MGIGAVTAFDWHGGPLTRATAVDAGYKNTQNVRRFLQQACGDGFAFDRAFMAWIRDGAPKTMGDVADEWLRRQRRPQDQGGASPEQRPKLR